MTVDSDELESLRTEVARLVAENELLRRSAASASPLSTTSSAAPKFPWADASHRFEPWLGNETVPLMTVADMSTSVQFYVDALGFSVTNKWVDDDGVLRWCQLRHGGAGLMLQQRVDATERPVLSTSPNRSDGTQRQLNESICLCIFCEDAIAVWNELRRRGRAHPTHPQVLNGLWVTGVADPEGIRIDFESECAQGLNEGTYWKDAQQEQRSKV